MMIKNRSVSRIVMLLVVLVAFNGPLIAQKELHNLPIKVGKFQPVDIKFDEEIVNAVLPCKGMYEFERSSNGKAYTIISQREDPGSSCFLTLVVGEGKKQRKHTFEIIYREMIPEDEMVYDFTDSKVLKNAIAENDKAQKDAAKSTAKTKQKETAPEPVQKPAPKVEPKVEPKTEPAPPTTTPPATTASSNTSAAADNARKDNYYKAIGNAELAINNKDYIKAEQYLNQAKSFEDPGSNYVKSRLADIAAKKQEQIEADKKEKALREKQDNYLNAIAQADAAMNKGDLAYATQQYRLALTYKSQDSYANNKIIEIDALLAKKKREEEQAEKMARYNASRNAGDKYFNEEQYDMARGAYTEALRIIPGDSYASNRVKEIQQNIAKKQEAETQKERQKSYNENILMADAAFKTGDYETAVEKYNIASKWKPSETYPARQLNEIKKLQVASALKAEEERKAIEKQKKLDNDYALLNSKANDLFNKREFDAALQQYQKALELKPYETYPAEKITEIKNIQDAIAMAAKARKDSIDAVNLKRAQYNDAVARGKKAYAVMDYPTAKSAYAEALQLFENEAYPREQIAVIDGILASIAEKERARQDSLNRIIAFNRKYDSILVIGANAMLVENYDASILAFREATVMKPQDIYARNLLRYVEERKKVSNDNLAIKTSADRREEYRDTKNRVIAAMKEKRYLDAQVLIRKALALMDPGEQYGTDKEYYDNRLAAIDNEILKAKEKGETLIPLSPDINESKILQPATATPTAPVATVSAASKQNIETISKNTIKSKEEITKTSSGAVRKDDLPVQQVGLPYSREELWKRYPGVNFMDPPPGQGFNVAEYYDTTENARLSKLVLLETDNRVNISDSHDGITLTCEGISFSGTNAYYRLRLQNKSATAFAVGVMNLVWQMSDGNEKKLYPGYVTGFPLLLPQKEIIMIYVAKSAYVENNDRLLFSLRDRSKTTRFDLVIPGDVYNSESNR